MFFFAFTWDLVDVSPPVTSFMAFTFTCLLTPCRSGCIGQRYTSRHWYALHFALPFFTWDLVDVSPLLIYFVLVLYRMLLTR